MNTARRCGWSTLAGLSLIVAGCTRDAPDPPAPPTTEAVQPLPNPYEGSPSRFGTVPIHAGFSPDPRVVAGVATGEVQARTIHRTCRGWVSERPDYLLDASTAFFKLYVLARSQEDLVLVVRTADGRVLCNDDRRGTTNPMVRTSVPMGATQVWVGVKREGQTADYRLGFSEVHWKPSVIAPPGGG